MSSKNRILNAEAIFKSLGPADGEPEGTFEALVSVFGNVDRHGDRVSEKAFDNTLAAWREKNLATGARIPIIFNHNWADPMAFVGSADPHDVKATDRGLLVKGRVEHTDTNPVAQQVHNLMKSRALTEWSFGYMVPKGGESKAADGAYDINDLELFEVGPTLKGVNPATELLAVKSDNGPERSKAYADVAGLLPDSYGAAQSALCDAVSSAYPSTDTDMKSAYVLDWNDSEVVFQVCSYGQDGTETQVYRASYTLDDDADTATLSDVTPVDIQATLVPDTDAAEDAAGKAETEMDSKADASRADLIKQAFAAAHSKYPDGVPESVTKQIFKDPQAFIDANKGKSDDDFEFKADYSTEERVAMAKRGEAIPVKNDAGEVIDGRYPIGNAADLEKAIRAIGRANDPDVVKAFIKKRASELGKTDLIPDGWKSLEPVESDAVMDRRVAELQLQEHIYTVGRAMSADEMEVLAKGREIEAALLALEAEIG